MTRLTAVPFALFALFALFAASGCKYTAADNNGDLGVLDFSGPAYVAVGHAGEYRVMQRSQATCTIAHRSCADDREYPVAIEGVSCIPSALCSARPEPSVSGGTFAVHGDEAGIATVRVEASFAHGTEMDELTIETVPLSSLRGHLLQLDCADCTEGDVVDGQELFLRRGEEATLFVEAYGAPVGGGEVELRDLRGEVEARVEGNISLSVFQRGAFDIHATEPGDSTMTLFLAPLEVTFTVHVE